MDDQEDYRVPESIKDAIDTLDLVPPRHDWVEGFVFVQLANLLPLAHLAIERGLKRLIEKATGVRARRIHSLDDLYKRLRATDLASADFLDVAFQDAVAFYGYDINREGFRHYCSLDVYLSQTGTKEAFEVLRYWPIGESSPKGNPFHDISLHIQRELLCALWFLFLPPRSENEPGRRETVSERVREKVSRDMRASTTSANSDSEERQQAVIVYRNWLNSHPSIHSALDAAVKQIFIISEEYNSANKLLRETYKKIQEPYDPAVLYYLSTLEYLPEGFEKRQADAIVGINWHDADQSLAEIFTPSRAPLGVISKRPNGAWAISEYGLSPARKTAWMLGGAIDYLVDWRSKQVVITKNQQSKQFRIITEKKFISSGDLLEFWDLNHGLSNGDQVSVMMLKDVGRNLVDVLTGTVEEVRGRTARIYGIIETRQGDKVVGSMRVGRL